MCAGRWRGVVGGGGSGAVDARFPPAGLCDGVGSGCSERGEQPRRALSRSGLFWRPALHVPSKSGWARGKPGHPSLQGPPACPPGQLLVLAGGWQVPALSLLRPRRLLHFLFSLIPIAALSSSPHHFPHPPPCRVTIPALSPSLSPLPFPLTLINACLCPCLSPFQLRFPFSLSPALPVPTSAPHGSSRRPGRSPQPREGHPGTCCGAEPPGAGGRARSPSPRIAQGPAFPAPSGAGGKVSKAGI